MVNQRPGTRQGNLWFLRGVLILLFEKLLGHSRKEAKHNLGGQKGATTTNAYIILHSNDIHTERFSSIEKDGRDYFIYFMP